MSGDPRRWEHFDHGADIGIRGCGDTAAAAFEQAALALTAVITDPGDVRESTSVTVSCEADDLEDLFLDWLNALVYEMAVNRLLFHRYHVEITGRRLRGQAWGETVDTARHHPVVEIKGATYTELTVRRLEDGSWLAQTVVDV
ncbi:MAG TPA: archease [Arenicellales bacterium]|nr:archease [Arenicellales bacterium]